MGHASGSPVLELLERPPEVLDDRTVDEFELTARGKDRDQSRNAVDDQARCAFAFVQRVLGTLPIVDVGQQDVPAKNPPAWIAERKPAHLTPVIDAVEAPDARFEI